MANLTISLNQGNPALRSTFSGSPLSTGPATVEALASAPADARANIEQRSQYMAGMSADEARTVQSQFSDLIAGKHS